MLRRLHPEQPDSFAFSEDNLAWAKAQISKFPEGRQASAIIPLLWRAQEQEGWLTRPAIESVAELLGMPYMRALEVATFYFMFQLQPVGSVAHIQVCGTTTCMICGAEDLIAVCREKIAPRPHQISADGKLSWEEVECLGACANAPMAQIGKDYYEDLTAERFAEILDELASGKVPAPGPQNGRYASEPKAGLTSLAEGAEDRARYNASVALAVDLGDTVKRIDGGEVPIFAPWTDKGANHAPKAPDAYPNGALAKGADGGDGADTSKASDEKDNKAEKDEKPAKPSDAKAKDAKKDDGGERSSSLGGAEGERPEFLDAPRDGKADDLKKIKGIGPGLEKVLNDMGVYHFDQIANWSAAEVAWVDENLVQFKGRVTRDDWVAQAKTLSDT